MHLLQNTQRPTKVCVLSLHCYTSPTLPPCPCSALPAPTLLSRLTLHPSFPLYLSVCLVCDSVAKGLEGGWCRQWEQGLPAPDVIFLLDILPEVILLLLFQNLTYSGIILIHFQYQVLELFYQPLFPASTLILSISALSALSGRA